MDYTYDLATDRPTRLGLLVLQADETVEDDLRRLLPDTVRLLVSRVPSGAEVSIASLAAMEDHLTAAAGLFPRGAALDAVGYACTSGSAQIGPERIAALVGAGVATRSVTNPLSALIAACRVTGTTRLAILSPYVASVSERLRAVLAESGVETPVFGTFAEPEEASVARIEEASVVAAACRMAEGEAVDALFLSCTNLRTLGAVPALEARLGLPVFSSNLVLAWHMLALAGHESAGDTPGTLLRHTS